MSDAWRYFAMRLTGDGSTGEVLDWDLPLSDPTITEVLSGPNRLTATINPKFRRLVGPDGRPLFEEYGTAIFAQAGERIFGGGILTDQGFREAEWSLDCMGYTGYAVGMPYTDSNFWVETDVLDIYRAIWTHLQSQRGGNLGLEFDQLKSGVEIGTTRRVASFDPGDNPDTGPTEFEAGPYRLAWYQDHDLSQNIDDLAGETPFDYRERHFWDGEELRHHVDLGYPRLGKRRDDLRFAIGENIDEPEVNPDGTTYADEVLFLGAGEGRTRKRGYATRKDHRLRRVRVVEDTSVRKLDSADKRAKREVARSVGLTDIGEVMVDDHPNAPLGSYRAGDEILIEGDSTWTDNVDTWVRILEIAYTPAAGTSATLTVTRSDKISQ